MNTTTETQLIELLRGSAVVEAGGERFELRTGGVAVEHTGERLTLLRSMPVRGSRPTRWCVRSRRRGTWGHRFLRS
ncbi:hypothetical protein [Promicromonospora sp. NPDC019610]|uniref:hypothetical protein n=1 Tax=Promicromonospora sp. NPDC019610 TaxID=3364405 RepID=UPI0037B92B31